MTFRLILVYRREDTGDITGRLFDRLCFTFGRESIFRDIDSIPPGYDFRAYLENAISNCQLLLFVMGRNWLGKGRAESRQRRIDNPFDYLRLEIEMGLQHNVPILIVRADNPPTPKLQDLPESIRQVMDQPSISLFSANFDNDYEIVEERIQERMRRKVENSQIYFKESGKSRGDSARYFVSYAREDLIFTRNLATRLLNEGIPVWMDELHMVTGRAWEDQVEQALRNSAALIFVMSQLSIAADNVRDELSLAIDLKKPVIPVKIDECEPPLRLRRIQYADFVRPFDLAFKKFLVDIRESVQPALHSPSEASRMGFNAIPLSNVAAAEESHRRLAGNWRRWFAWAGLH